MDLKSTGNQEIDNLILELKNGMYEYMEESEDAYSHNDIDETVSLLIDHVTKVLATKNSEEAMSIVESTVLSLNELNERCDEALIETIEREKIAEIIILAGHVKGYNSLDEDITEEWREW